VLLDLNLTADIFHREAPAQQFGHRPMEDKGSRLAGWGRMSTT
jgi:hypothetical protein